jgi:Zn-dependent metalloprotease
MNINAVRNFEQFAPPQIANPANNQQPVSTIAVGEPHPSQPMTTITREAISASYNYLARQMKTLDASKVESSFQVTKYHTDELGMTHVRMQQMINGVRVYGQEVITHIKDGQVQSMTGAYREDLLNKSMSVRPLLGRECALRRVNRHYQGKVSSPKMELLLYPSENRGTRLAYKVEFFDTSAPARMTYFVDARNGRILDRSNSLPTYAPTPAATEPRGIFSRLDSSLRRLPTQTRNFVARASQMGN